MAVAMAEVARSMMDQGDLEATKATVNEPVTAEELIMLQKFGLESKWRHLLRSYCSIVEWVVLIPVTIINYNRWRR